jgi:hypothetical protein
MLLGKVAPELLGRNPASVGVSELLKMGELKSAVFQVETVVLRLAYHEYVVGFAVFVAGAHIRS